MCIFVYWHFYLQHIKWHYAIKTVSVWTVKMALDS